MDYLRAAEFRSRNSGPRIAKSRCRDPSVEQIRSRCALIRDSWPALEERLRREFSHDHARGESDLPEWTIPVVSVAEDAGLTMNSECE
jgi:hypothetical protein